MKALPSPVAELLPGPCSIYRLLLVRFGPRPNHLPSSVGPITRNFGVNHKREDFSIKLDKFSTTTLKKKNKKKKTDKQKRSTVPEVSPRIKSSAEKRTGPAALGNPYLRSPLQLTVRRELRDRRTDQPPPFHRLPHPLSMGTGRNTIT